MAAATIASFVDAYIILEICAVLESGLAMTPNTLMPQDTAQKSTQEATAAAPPPNTVSVPSPTPPATAAKSKSSKGKPVESKAEKSKAEKSKADKSKSIESTTTTPSPASELTPPGEAASVGDTPRTQAQIDAEIAARKRQEIGLSPRRNTAQSEVARPPARSKQRNGVLYWIGVTGLSVVALALAWMLVSRFMAEQPTVASLNEQFNAMLDDSVTGAISTLSTLSEDPAALLRTPGSLPIREEFEGDDGPLVRDFQPRRWSMGPVPDEGVYRIRMWPGVVAWSTLGIEPVPAYTLATEMIVSSETPWGFGGLMTRYSDPRNFLFFQVDGQGRYRVQKQENGVWSTMQDWTEASVLQTAGLPNTIAVDDSGALAILYANGEAIYTTPELGIPQGDAGVLAGSLDPAVAEVNFSRVEMSTPEY